MKSLNLKELEQLLHSYESDLNVLKVQLSHKKGQVSDLKEEVKKAKKDEPKKSKKEKKAKSGKRGRPKGSKNKDAKEVKVKKTGKRGRPKGSTNKSTSASTDVVKKTGKRGRPKGSLNKSTLSADAPVKKPGKRGRPKGSGNKMAQAVSMPKKTGKRGRPKGSTNKSTPKVQAKSAGTGRRGRPAGSKNKVKSEPDAAPKSTVSAKKNPFLKNPNAFDWKQAIIGTIEENKKVILSSKLFDNAVESAKVANLNMTDSQIRTKIISNLKKMLNKRTDIRTVKTEKYGYVYGLVSWFETDGSIKKPFKLK